MIYLHDILTILSSSLSSQVTRPVSISTRWRSRNTDCPATPSSSWPRAWPSRTKRRRTISTPGWWNADWPRRYVHRAVATSPRVHFFFAHRLLGLKTMIWRKHFSLTTRCAHYHPTAVNHESLSSVRNRSCSKTPSTCISTHVWHFNV